MTKDKNDNSEFGEIAQSMKKLIDALEASHGKIDDTIKEKFRVREYRDGELVSDSRPGDTSSTKETLEC